MPPKARALAEQAVTGSPVPRLEIPGWRDLGAVAGLTGADAGSDLSFLGDDPERYDTESWKAFRDLMAPEFPTVVLSNQVHGNLIATHRDFKPGIYPAGDADGHITLSPGVLLSITVADCVPVYLFHPPTGAVGLLHAGWRGIAAGILESGLELLGTLSEAPPSETLIHCGISICGRCYEVSSDVIAEVERESNNAPPGHLDLRMEVAARARALGACLVTISPYCTAHDPGFYSHRASGGSPGRQLAYIGAPSRLTRC